MDIKYTAKNGEFEQGVPARDLSPDEWAQLPKELQERLLSQGMYKLTKTKKEGE